MQTDRRSLMKFAAGAAPLVAAVATKPARLWAQGWSYFERLAEMAANRTSPDRRSWFVQGFKYELSRAADQEKSRQ